MFAMGIHPMVAVTFLTTIPLCVTIALLIICSSVRRGVLIYVSIKISNVMVFIIVLIFLMNLYQSALIVFKIRTSFPAESVVKWSVSPNIFINATP